jgi:hypothetical protein
MSILKLSDDELKILTDLHRRAQETIFQVGQSEIRKEGLLAQVRQVNQQAQEKMNEVATRLNITPGTPWQMLPDGTVVLLDPTSGNPVTTSIITP